MNRLLNFTQGVVILVALVSYTAIQETAKLAKERHAEEVAIYEAFFPRHEGLCIMMPNDQWLFVPPTGPSVTQTDFAAKAYTLHIEYPDIKGLKSVPCVAESIVKPPQSEWDALKAQYHVDIVYMVCKAILAYAVLAYVASCMLSARPAPVAKSPTGHHNRIATPPPSTLQFDPASHNVLTKRHVALEDAVNKNE